MSVSIIDSKIWFGKINSWGEEINTEKEDADRFKIELIIDFYNKSEIPKPIKIYVLFCKIKKATH